VTSILNGTLRFDCLGPANELLRYLIIFEFGVTWTTPCTQTLSSAPGIFDG
jgi:hypothetical protein